MTRKARHREQTRGLRAACTCTPAHTPAGYAAYTHTTARTSFPCNLLSNNRHRPRRLYRQPAQGVFRDLSYGITVIRAIGEDRQRHLSELQYNTIFIIERGAGTPASWVTAGNWDAHLHFLPGRPAPAGGVPAG